MNATMPAPRTLVLPDTGATPDAATGSLLFIGTATVLLRYAGFSILTDPNFLHRGEQIRLGFGLRSTRRTNPALDIDELPLDHALPVVTTRHAAAALRSKGFHAARGLPTWRTQSVVKGNAQLRIT